MFLILQSKKVPSASRRAVPQGCGSSAGKKYAIVLLLTNSQTGEVESERACGIFKQTEWCTEDDECGPWEFTEHLGQRNEWTLSIQLEADGEIIDGVGYGVTERRSRKSSIGGAFLLTFEGVSENVGITGTQTTRSKCLEWAESDD